MKTFNRTFVLVAFIGLICIGCSDKSITPVETTGANNNPVTLQKDTGPGAWIIKDEFYGGYWFTDQESGLVLVIGLSDPWLRCSEGDHFELFEFKDIYLPNTDPDLRRIVEQIKGNNLTAFIWHPDPWPIEFTTFCNFLATAGDPLAVGTASISYKDNDVFAYEQDNKNHNAYGFKANGTLLSPDGKKYQLNLVWNSLWDGEDGNSYKEVYKIQLTPTGK
jgi:hypothetical protein